jgi:hypothetical protein
MAEFDRPIGIGTVVEVDTTSTVDIATLAQEVSVQLGG